MKNKFLSGALAFFIATAFVSCGEEGGSKDTNADSTSTAQTTDTAAAQDTIKIHGTLEFNAADGLAITADSYEVLPGEKYILLCHQAGYSRGEYIETAKKLNENHIINLLKKFIDLSREILPHSCMVPKKKYLCAENF